MEEFNEQCINEKFNPLFINLVPAEEASYYFLQDGACPHTATETIQALHGVFGELKADYRIISKKK
jgi:hypothetical protein